MPRKLQLTDLQLILLSTASTRVNGHLYPLKGSIAGKTDDVAVAVTALLKRGLVEEVAASDASRMWEERDGERLGLVITAKGRALIDGAGPGGETVPAPAPATSAPRAGSKTQMVLALLGREEGATPAELIDATGWLPHTMRAALTGLRKKGHGIELGKRGEERVYRLTGAAVLP
ncbi:MAG: DUF3489 domain-containing protein [Sphingobium sp.]|nr:DUF3489 domain-containing protein [Sphingobium sp.]